jgi:hypothetical protein
MIEQDMTTKGKPINGYSTVGSREDIKKRFTHYPPNGNCQISRYEAIREGGRELAHFIDTECPDSREKALAITKLEEAVMWANAAIARNE